MVISLAPRKSDGFDSRTLHQITYMKGLKMALDMHDLKTIQTEFKIIGSKIETLNSSLKEFLVKFPA